MPRLLQWMYPKRIWAFPRGNNNVYLTFDDGPIPKVTPWILDQLKNYDAKATFFCIGDNIRKNPEIFRRIIAEGHSVGNHTYNHLNGWQTNPPKYLENIERAEREIRKNSEFDHQIFEDQNSLLFRPPYGKMTSKQAGILQNKGYRIVMWDIISYDYDADLSKDKCLDNVLKNIEPGSIVVFHDSIKAEKNLRYVLPKLLEFTKQNNWLCKPIAINP